MLALETSEYSALDMDSRLLAFQALLQLVMDGPGMRDLMEQRAEEHARLRRQLREEASREKQRKKEEAAARAAERLAAAEARLAGVNPDAAPVVGPAGLEAEEDAKPDLPAEAPEEAAWGTPFGPGSAAGRGRGGAAAGAVVAPIPCTYPRYRAPGVSGIAARARCWIALPCEEPSPGRRRPRWNVGRYRDPTGRALPTCTTTARPISPPTASPRTSSVAWRPRRRSGQSLSAWTAGSTATGGSCRGPRSGPVRTAAASSSSWLRQDPGSWCVPCHPLFLGAPSHT